MRLAVALWIAGCGAADVAEEPGAPIAIALEAPVAETRPEYLSFAIDVSALVRQDPYDFSRARLRTMASALGPAVLRVGGTFADSIWVDLSDAPVTEPPAEYEHILTKARFDALCGFATDLGFEIAFTLNGGPGPRGAGDVWTSDQARLLVEHAVATGCPVGTWELGNEINLFGVESGLQLDGHRYAADFGVFRDLLDEIDPDARAAGPSSAYFPIEGELPAFDLVMDDFLTDAGPDVDVVTWHYYPQQSDQCPYITLQAELETLFDPAALDTAARWAGEVETLTATHAPDAEVWLGETGHAQCGGQEGLSDRFVSSFWWLDQLGLLARRGEAIQVRQALTGGRYHLIDLETLEPAPDWFASLLWKRLVGPKALGVTLPPEAGDTVRAYAACTPGETGSITALLLNLSTEASAPLDFAGIDGPRELYLVTAPDLVGSEVDLNGVAMAVDDGGTPPETDPVGLDGALVLPPRSYAFVVMPEASAPACP